MTDPKEAEAPGPSAAPETHPLVDAFIKIAVGLVTTAAVVAFVAATGAALTWVELRNAELPATRALQVIPRSDLLLVGQINLLLFVVLGLLAVVAAYGADPAGRATDDMRSGLAALMTVEVIVAVLLVDGAPTENKVIACVVLSLAGLLGILAAVFTRVRPEGEGPAEVDVEAPARRDAPRGLAWMGSVVKWLNGSPWPVSPIKWLVAVLLWTRDWLKWLAWRISPKIATSHVIPKTLAQIKEDRERERLGFEATEIMYRRELKYTAVAVGGVVVAAITVLLWRLFPNDLWVAGSLLAATALALVCMRAAQRSGGKFWPYGLAVFFSVVLFGAALNLVRNLDNVRVEPAALIRKGNSGVVGLFIAKTDKHYWLAAQTMGCVGDKPHHVIPGSARLFSVPVDQVVADVIGSPREPIEKDSGRTAGDRALDLLQELARRQSPNGETTATVTPTPSASPTTTATPTPTPAPAPAVDDTVMVPTALAMTGQCVQPPARLTRLDPETASPGDEVRIIGIGLGPETKWVTLDGVGVTPVAARADESITITVPESVLPGNVRVRVRVRHLDTNSLELAIRAP